MRTGQIKGKHLKFLGTDHLRKGFRLFFVPYLPVKEQISLLRRFSIHYRGNFSNCKSFFFILIPFCSR